MKRAALLFLHSVRPRYQALFFLTAFLCAFFFQRALLSEEPQRPDIVISDFEGQDYEGWTAEGDAFGTAPGQGYKRCGMGYVFGYHGRKLVNTFLQNKDDSTGSLTSPEFTIERKNIVFYIGGGHFPGETGVSLVIDGQEVLTETGLFSVPQVGHEGLERKVWNVEPYMNRKARFVIFDKKKKDNWAHIKVDYVYQTDSVSANQFNELTVADSAAPIPYDRMIFGQFVEHFHRQVYGGIFEPGSPLSDAAGFRQDVVEALKELNIPIVRWPGGCFVSAYHWINGVGPERQPYYDKAWHVEDPNTFGTAEYVQWCRLIGAEPYICTNAGTGTPEEMSDWVEYCNLNVGKFGRMRAEHGYKEPFNVKYWSIGNENWGGHEMGAKTVAEWGPFVRESGKLMINTDANIKLFAAALPNEDWTIPLLNSAGYLLDYVSIHGYWSWLDANKKPLPYPECMTLTNAPEQDILHTIDMLERTGRRGKTKIAFDEWNLRGWYHPGIGNPKALDLDARKLNDDNSVYTMADAVFAACFLNSCLRHCEDVEIACFSPIVNVRGALYVYPEGIVKRPTFHLFKLYGSLLEKNYLPVEFYSEPLTVGKKTVPKLDAAVTVNDAQDKFTLVFVNKDPENAANATVPWEKLLGHTPQELNATVLAGDAPDDYNDVGRENNVVPEEKVLKVENGQITLPAHSITFIRCSK